jgi:hypothetical protein
MMVFMIDETRLSNRPTAGGVDGRVNVHHKPDGFREHRYKKQTARQKLRYVKQDILIIK